MTDNKPKKFVFLIEPENIQFIESLSYQDKQDVINELISNYQNNRSYSEKTEADSEWLKKFIAFAIAVVVGIPLLLVLLSFSLNLTKDSYMYMQTNFEKVYPSTKFEKNEKGY